MTPAPTKAPETMLSGAPAAEVVLVAEVDSSPLAEAEVTTVEVTVLLPEEDPDEEDDLEDLWDEVELVCELEVELYAVDKSEELTKEVVLLPLEADVTSTLAAHTVVVTVAS